MDELNFTSSDLFDIILDILGIRAYDRAVIMVGRAAYLIPFIE